MRGRAHRIHTPRLVVRCWHPADAALLGSAIDESLDHLRPWMPWAAREPQPVERRARRLGRFRAAFESGRDLVYAIFSADEAAVIGGTGLHFRIGAGAAEIGYWIRADHVRHGYATEAAAAMTRVGFEIERLGRLEIHCDPRNEPSVGVARKLGFRHQVTVAGWINSPRRIPRDTMIWTLLAADYPHSAAARMAPVEAFDAVGERLTIKTGGGGDPPSPSVRCRPAPGVLPLPLPPP